MSKKGGKGKKKGGKGGGNVIEHGFRIISQAPALDIYR